MTPDSLPRQDQSIAQAASQVSVPSISRRIASLPYEALLLLALVLIASFPIAGLKEATLHGSPHLLFQAYLFAVTATYFVWQWQKTGQTLPMKTWRFRVVSTNGGLVSWQRGLVRYICVLVFFGPAWAGVFLLFFPARMSPAITMWFFLPMIATLLFARFDHDRQFLHDRLAGTKIIEAPLPSKS